jgi:acetyl-CoA acetyltransferase
VILAREDLVRSRQPGRTVVSPLASSLQSESYARGHTFVGPVVGPSTMTRDTARECYEAASLGPDDVSLAFCHDAFVNEELEYYELLGFCAEGDGDKLVEEGETGPGGRIPFNTDGGLIARGHPGGPTGLAQIHESVLQLRGEASGRQVDGARVALAHLVGGGSICTVNLLERKD